MSNLTIARKVSQETEKVSGEKILDGYYLLNCAKLDDPQDICSVDISNQGEFQQDLITFSNRS
jgi:hypothetical protein